MIPIANLITSLATNKHTSGAALIYAASKFGCPLASTWFPGHKTQIEATAEILQGLSVFYGLAAAGDASKSLTKEQADTQFIKRDETKTP